MPDPRAHRVLASVSRVAVLEVLRTTGRPLAVQELADAMGLHPNTVRKHLDLLVSHGHVTRARDVAGARGRPRQVYAAAGAGEPREHAQLRDYRLLAAVLAGYLRGSADPDAALEAGRRAGAELVGGGPTDGVALERVVRMLDDIGFRPELTADRSAIRLHHCPFHELARDQPDLVCRIHLGLIRGALEQLGAPVAATRLVPSVAPRRYVVELGEVGLRPPPRDDVPR